MYFLFNIVKHLSCIKKCPVFFGAQLMDFYPILHPKGENLGNSPNIGNQLILINFYIFMFYNTHTTNVKLIFWTKPKFLRYKEKS